MDRVSAWVLQQQKTAKKFRLNDVADTYERRDHSPRRRTNRVDLNLKDDFNKCQWSTSVGAFEWTGSGAHSSGLAGALSSHWSEQARKCLMLRRRWVAWSEDVLWREALQVHMVAWEDLRKAALSWPVTPHGIDPPGCVPPSDGDDLGTFEKNNSNLRR